MYDRPTVPEMASWVREFFRLPGNGMGGALHVVLCDANLEDSSVEHCRQSAIERGDVEGERLAETIARMSVTQRRKLYNLDGKYAFETTTPTAASPEKAPLENSHSMAPSRRGE